MLYMERFLYVLYSWQQFYGVLTAAHVGTNKSIPSCDTPSTPPLATVLLHEPINAASALYTLYITRLFFIL